jgi:hypothetical protein
MRWEWRLRRRDKGESGEERVEGVSGEEKKMRVRGIGWKKWR